MAVEAEKLRESFGARDLAAALRGSHYSHEASKPPSRGASDKRGSGLTATRIALLTAFTEAIAAGQPDRFKPAVRAAHEGGADRDALFVAVDVAHVLAQVPAHVVAHAHATIHAWHWIVARRAVHQRVVVDQAA